MTEREALIASIEKWDAIAEGTRIDDGDACPLCEYYESDCKKCVVKSNFCKDTPYHKWYQHHRAVHGLLIGDMGIDCPECVRLAKSEADFLRGLL